MRGRSVATPLLAIGLLVVLCGRGRCQFSDEFNGPTLDPRWIVLTPPTPGSHFELSSRPGFLHLVSSDIDAPQLVQPVSGTWTLDALIEFSPADDFESAGVLVDGEQVAGIAFDARVGGPVVRCLGHYQTFTGSPVLFRITQYGDLMVGFWAGPDGIWHEDLSGQRNQVVSSVGLYLARHDQDGQTPRPASAYVDYFRCGSFTPTAATSRTWARLKRMYR